MYNERETFVLWWDQMEPLFELEKPDTPKGWAQTAWLARAQNEEITIGTLRKQLTEHPTRTLAEAFQHAERRIAMHWNVREMLEKPPERE
jgi:hypothetical protein